MLRTLPVRAFRATATVALATVLAVTMVPAVPISASDTTDLAVELTLGLPCVNVDSWQGGKITAIQRRRGKVLKTSSSNPFTTLGTVCLTPFRAGDRLTLKRGSVSRTVTVPAATLRVDLAGDMVSGTVPAATTQLSMTVQDFTAGYYAGTSMTSLVGVAGGSFSTDTTGTLDIGRGDRVSVTWSNGADTWRQVSETGTAVVWMGASGITGTGRVASRMKVTLRSAKGKVRATASAKVQYTPIAAAGFFSATFLNRGRRVVASGGNRVSSTQLSGSFRLPTDMPVVDIGANAVRATCPAGSDWLVLHDGTMAARGTTSSGAIAASPVNVEGPLTLGTRVIVACQTPAGFGFIRELALE